MDGMSTEINNPTTKPCDRSRILVADDEAPVRHLFSTILSYGVPEARIDQACNGLEAVKTFQGAHHGVILMDLRMPEMDGFNAALAIRDFCRTQNWQMPSIVFCTGFAPPTALDEIIGDGKLHGLLRKPVTSEQIITTVKSRLQAMA